MSTFDNEYVLWNRETGVLIDWYRGKDAAIQAAKELFEDTEEEHLVLKPVLRVYDKNAETVEMGTEEIE